MNKDKARQKILQVVLSSEVTKGHLKWKVADIARSANSSRALIYYYFGKSKEEILQSCLTLIADDYFALSDERAKMFEEGRIAESLTITRHMFLKNQALGVLYQRGRITASPLRDKLVEIEEKYQKKLRKVFPHLSAGDVAVFHAFFHGIITAPFLDEKTFKEAATKLEKMLLRK